MARTYEANLQLLRGLICPAGAFTYLLTLCKKEKRQSQVKDDIWHFYCEVDSERLTLWNNLESFGSSSSSGFQPEQLINLLDRLEALVVLPTHWSPGTQHARLQALAVRYCPGSEVPHPAEKLFQAENKSLRDIILAHFETLSRCLERHSNDIGVPEPIGASKTLWLSSFARRRHLDVSQRLFKTLEKVSKCQSCRIRDIRLALTTQEEVIDDMSLGWEILVNLSGQLKWREMNIWMKHLEIPKHTGTVRFADEERRQSLANSITTSVSPLPTKMKAIRRVKHLCHCLANPQNAFCRLQLLFGNEAMFETNQPSDTIYTTQDLENAIPLSKLLSQQMAIQSESRLVLAVILCRALLNYHGSPWLQIWNRDCILFLRERSRIPIKPFLSTTPKTATNGCWGCHPYPNILALGIMLLELRVGQPLESYVQSQGGLPEAGPNYLYKLAKTALETLQLEDQYQSAVSACLDLKFACELANGIFEDGSCSEDDDDEFYEDITQSEEFRSVIYTRIVRPLEDQLRTSFGISADAVEKKAAGIDISSFEVVNPAQHNMAVSHEAGPPAPQATSTQVEPIVASAQDLPTRADMRPELWKHSDARPPKRAKTAPSLAPPNWQPNIFDDRAEEEAESPSALKTDEWLCDLKRVAEAIRHSPISFDHQKVKIAILDTGIDTLHQDIFARAEKIRDTVSWARDGLGARETRTKDCHGHGTAVASIILSIAEDADVYIAKVTNDDGTSIAEEDVAAAIRHASTEWKVDIMVTSFGFPDRKPMIEAAIRESKAIIFAAAANHGGNSQRAFPARQEGVVCVHSTDGLGNPSSFNPTRLLNNDNFSILGESIDVAWIGHDGKHQIQRRSGTSFAAPVAAGVAALVLEYGRANLADYKQEFQLLHSQEGMKHVFRLMTEKRGEYDYIVPWKLFRIAGARKDLAYQHLRFAILQVLESA